MTRIRILLVGLPPLLRDILGEAFARESDVDVVTSDAPHADLPSLVRVTRPDVIMTTASTVDASVTSDLRRIVPLAVVVAIASKGDRATLFRAGAEPLEIADLSLEVLLRAIRDHFIVNDKTRLPLA